MVQLVCVSHSLYSYGFKFYMDRRLILLYYVDYMFLGLYVKCLVHFSHPLRNFRTTSLRSSLYTSVILHVKIQVPMRPYSFCVFYVNPPAMEEFVFVNIDLMLNGFKF